MDYSTASLEAVEIFTVNTLAATQDLMLRAAVTAYVGECLLRTGGEKWMWNEDPASLTNGFPVVRRSVKRMSPTHLIEFAWARQDGQTFARIHRAWITEATTITGARPNTRGSGRRPRDWTSCRSRDRS